MSGREGSKLESILSAVEKEVRSSKFDWFIIREVRKLFGLNCYGEQEKKW